MTGALTHLPQNPFLSFMGLPTETDLDRLDAAFAIVGAPFGSPYHMRVVLPPTEAIG